MRFARARQAAILPAAAYMFLSAVLMFCSSSPAFSQTPARSASLAGHSTHEFPGDFTVRF
jgi:hypothetical protein